MMFFRSIGSVFRGGSAFPEFVKRNPAIALFHLFLFCFLLSLICSGIQVYYIGKKIDICTGGLQKHFGRIQRTDLELLPEKNAEIPSRFYFPGNVRLDYFPADCKFSEEEMKDWKQHMGVLWVRRGFLVWTRSHNDTYYLFPLQSKELDLNGFFKPVNTQEIAAKVKHYQDEHKIDDLPVTYLEFSELGTILKINLYLAFSIFNGLGNFFLTLILLLMCAGLQAFWKARGLEMLSFGGTLAMLCYAAFPALALKMVLDAFSFPQAGDILFFIVFFIYQTIAFNELRRSMENRHDVERD